jgi:hypothetical protein
MSTGPGRAVKQRIEAAVTLDQWPKADIFCHFPDVRVWKSATGVEVGSDRAGDDERILSHDRDTSNQLSPAQAG